MSKALYFLTGLAITFLIIFGMLNVLTKSAPIAAVPAPAIFSESDLQKVKSKTNGLENYGGLPVVVTGDQIGRENPFDPYK